MLFLCAQDPVSSEPVGGNDDSPPPLPAAFGLFRQEPLLNLLSEYIGSCDAADREQAAADAVTQVVRQCASAGMAIWGTFCNLSRVRAQ